MFNRFGVSNSDLVFCHSSQILAPYPMKSNEGLNISINPIFPIFVFFNFCFDCLLGCLFLLKPFFFFLVEHFSTFEEPHHLHLLQLNSLVFFLPILFSHFLLYLSNLYLQESCKSHRMVSATTMVEIHPFQCPQLFDLAFLHLELLWHFVSNFIFGENSSIVYTQCNKKQTRLF